MIDFEIQSSAPISQAFLALGINRFVAAAHHVKHLPYQRNTDKNNPLIVLEEQQGTCSTKHALLVQLAHENQHNSIALILGVFKMGGEYSKSVGNVLAKYKLSYVPEAHNYLRYEGKIYDYTTPTSAAEDFKNDLMVEIPITPQQITDYKVDFHKQQLQRWIEEEQLPYTLYEIWAIREECIAALANN